MSLPTYGSNAIVYQPIADTTSIPNPTPWTPPSDWIDISESGEADRYFDFIAEDFVYYGPGELPIDNPDSLRAFLEPFFKNYTFSMPEWKTREIIINGNIAIHIWSGIAYIESNDGGSSAKLDRKYLDVYRKDKRGEWKCYIHSFNNNN